MKTLTILAMLFCFGCATPPQRPNIDQMALDVMAGKYKGVTVQEINQQFEDYDKARAEYEQTATYKATLIAVAPLLLLGGAMGDMPYCGYRGSGYQGYHGYGGKTVLTSTPIGGGAYQTVIKGYR